MTQLLRSIRLTDNMKKVMTKIIAAPTPEVAAMEISRGQNLVAARDILARLGMIDYDDHDNTASVTDTGLETLKHENLVDDSGQLTPDGQQIAGDNTRPGNIDMQAPVGKAQDMGPLGGQPEGPLGGAPEQPPGEQPLKHESEDFSLLQILNA